MHTGHLPYSGRCIPHRVFNCQSQNTNLYTPGDGGAERGTASATDRPNTSPFSFPTTFQQDAGEDSSSRGSGVVEVNRGERRQPASRVRADETRAGTSAVRGTVFSQL